MNPHRKKSLYETFPMAVARCIVRRPEFHCRSKYGSCLNIEETEFSMQATVCLKGRNPEEHTLRRNISVYEAA